MSDFFQKIKKHPLSPVASGVALGGGSAILLALGVINYLKPNAMPDNLALGSKLQMSFIVIGALLAAIAYGLRAVWKKQDKTAGKLASSPWASNRGAYSLALLGSGLIATAAILNTTRLHMSALKLSFWGVGGFCLLAALVAVAKMEWEKARSAKDIADWNKEDHAGLNLCTR